MRRNQGKGRVIEDIREWPEVNRVSIVCRDGMRLLAEREFSISRDGNRLTIQTDMGVQHEFKA